MSKTMASRLADSLRQIRNDHPPATAKTPIPSRAKAALKTKSKVKRNSKARTRVPKTRASRANTRTRAMTEVIRAPRRNVVPRAGRFARQNDQAPPPTSLDHPWNNLHPERIWPD